jgi:hypothetical protein
MLALISFDEMTNQMKRRPDYGSRSNPDIKSTAANRISMIGCGVWGFLGYGATPHYWVSGASSVDLGMCGSPTALVMTV